MSASTDHQLKRIEMKFHLDATLAQEVRHWAREHLGVDENCSSESGDTYDINTLYLDTPELDIFHRTGRVGTVKHRIRRYGNEQTLWLETKRKKEMVVCKNRTAVFESDLMPRCTGDYTDAWCGNWFLDRVAQRQLQPAIRIAYRRFARVATLGGESMRLTIDSQMSWRPVCGWNVGQVGHSVEDAAMFGDGEILELKFHDSMPWLLKELLQTFAIPATAFSKYRTAVAAHLSEPVDA